MKKIFTLGTGRRSEEDFIEVVLASGINAIIDVRSIPKSKNPAFTGQNLEALLKENLIDYYYLGRELGGIRKGGYALYTLTEDFRRGLERLEGIAENKLSAIICSEHFPWKCHRKWISRELHKRDWAVEHIIDKGKIWIPK